MKELVLKIKFDDKGCYDGHGDASEAIKSGLEQYMQMDLESDGVIKEGWSVEASDVVGFGEDEEGEFFMMSFGDENTIFKTFDYELSEEEKLFLKESNNKVNLSITGFAEEWEDCVDYDKSYAYLEDGKLNVVVYGIQDHISKQEVVEYFGEVLESYMDRGYGEFFETDPGCPICVVVERDGKEVIV